MSKRKKKEMGRQIGRISRWIEDVVSETASFVWTVFTRDSREQITIAKMTL